MIAAALLSLAACGGGDGAVDPGPDPNPSPNRADLVGTVRDAVGAVLPGVAVLLGQNPSVTDAQGGFLYANLLPGSYTLSLQDGQGNFDCRNLTISAGDLSLDLTLPRPGTDLAVTSVEPALNAANVQLDANLHLTFAVALDFGSVSANDFTITPEIGSFAVSDREPGSTEPASGESGRQVWLLPELQLPVDQVTYVELSGEIRDSEGQALVQPVRWRFRTSGVDSYPPQLVQTFPADGATNAPPNSAVRFEYSEAIADPDTDVVISIEPVEEFNAYASGRNLIISAEGGWEKNTAYRISVVNVADVLGNRDSGHEVSFSFTTGEQSSPLNYQDPEWNRANNLIVLAADTGGSYDIFSVNPDGSGLTQQTTLPGDEREPTLSSDGTLLAFQHRDQGGKWSIMVQDLDGSEAVQLTPADYNDTQPQFSRTISDKIIFVSDRSEPVGLYLMNSDGSNPVEQDRDFSTSQRDPALHPLLDTQMLFTAGGGSDRDIWRKTVSAIDGSAINQNFTRDLLATEHSPAWGPDAGFIVYISDYAGVENLWFAEATGELAVQLTTFEQPVLDVSVAPAIGDARAVLSVADGQGGSRLVMVDLISGDPLDVIAGEEGGD